MFITAEIQQIYVVQRRLYSFCSKNVLQLQSADFLLIRNEVKCQWVWCFYTRGKIREETILKSFELLSPDFLRSDV